MQVHWYSKYFKGVIYIFLKLFKDLARSKAVAAAQILVEIN